jgi:hypothetical protein
MVFFLIAMPFTQTGGVSPASFLASALAERLDQPTPSPELQVFLHPDGQIHVGDRVSVDAFLSGAKDHSTGGLQLNDNLRVRVIYPIQKDLGGVNFQRFQADTQRAILTWTWDTHGLAPGVYVLEFSLTPQEITWQKSVTLRAAPPEEATWKTVKTDCCEIHVISGTKADRDLATLVPMLNAQAKDVAAKMHTSLQHPIVINLVPRVVGHGGFTTDEVTVSYPDLNYPDIDVEIVAHHEMVHAVDATLGGELRPTLLVEGLAVYLSGGHFKPEPITERAAALIQLGWFIPLPELADNFYPSQHETGYTEAAALVKYLVDRFGWDRYNQFYRDIHPTDDKKDSTALDVGLRKNLGLSLTELDQEFMQYLSQQEVSDANREDLEATVRYYDTVRAYQKQLDPTAYFQQVWLPAPKEMRAKGIVGDYLSSPAAPQNLAVMGVLAQAGQDLKAGRYDQVAQKLDVVDHLLQRLPQAGELIPLDAQLPVYVRSLGVFLRP